MQIVRLGQQLPRLRELNLGKNFLVAPTAHDIEALGAALPNLRTLVLSSTGVSFYDVREQQPLDDQPIASHFAAIIIDCPL